MRHVRTPALWLVVLSSWAAGYPTASPAGNTTGPTRIELLAARSQHHAPTAADKRENAELHHGVSASPAPVPSTSASSAPAFDSGDRTRVEFERSRPALGYFQTLLVDALQPQPILDTIREDEKYGNDGEALGQVGRTIVGGVTKFTSFLSSTVDLPYEVLKSFTRKATETLNNIGAKIIGI